MFGKDCKEFYVVGDDVIDGIEMFYKGIYDGVLFVLQL